MKYIAILLLLLLTPLYAVNPIDRLTDAEKATFSQALNTPSGTYPVFQIWVPTGVTEVQVRASLNNYQSAFHFSIPSSFLLNLNYRCIGSKNNRNYYVVDTDPTDYCYWDNTGWKFAKYPSITMTGDFIHPWNATPSFGTLTEITDDAYRFCYMWCTTGWNTSSGNENQDTSAALCYIANQYGKYTNTINGLWADKGTAGSQQADYMKSQLLIFGTDINHQMPSQLQPAGSPGHTILFQPSHASNLFAGYWGNWMVPSNDHLQWSCQYCDANGVWQVHPDGTPLFNIIRPTEWRISPLLLQKVIP